MTKHTSVTCITSQVTQWQRISLPMQETQETQVQSLGREDPLEYEMATTPVLLPGESHGGRSLVGYSPWGHKDSDASTHQESDGVIHVNKVGAQAIDRGGF